jgi:hypothetical protein
LIHNVEFYFESQLIGSAKNLMHFAWGPRDNPSNLQSSGLDLSMEPLRLRLIPAVG